MSALNDLFELEITLESIKSSLVAAKLRIQDGVSSSFSRLLLMVSSVCCNECQDLSRTHIYR